MPMQCSSLKYKISGEQDFQVKCKLDIDESDPCKAGAIFPTELLQLLFQKLLNVIYLLGYQEIMEVKHKLEVFSFA